jgi:peptide/nickel transport system ATP-binding protein
MTTVLQPTSPSSDPILVVEDLHVAYPNRDGVLVDVVRGVSFTLGARAPGSGGRVGLRQVTNRACHFGPDGAGWCRDRQADGISWHRPAPLLCRTAAANARRPYRDGAAGPKYSLNPVMTIGAQVVESLRAHSKLSKTEARERAWLRCARCRLKTPSACFALPA